MPEREPADSNSHGKSRSGDEEPVSFEHDRVNPTPKQSQKRLFRSRHRQARRQRRSERRQNRLRKVVLPFVITLVFVVLGTATVRNWYLGNKEAEEKLAREAEAREQREKNPAEAFVPEKSKLDEARQRFLLREAPLSEARPEVPKN